MGGLAVAGINVAAGTDFTGWAIFLVTAIVITIMMIIFIIMFSRWGGKD